MKKTNPQLAEAIIKAVYNDFTYRRGLRQAWEEIDDDIKDEILKSWLLKAKNILDDNDVLT